MESQFKVKIIGGKLVHVPAYDYVKEHGRRGNRPYNAQQLPGRYDTLQKTDQTKVHHPANYLESINNGGYRRVSYQSRSLGSGPRNMIGVGSPGLSQSTTNLSQRVSNQLEAEKNKLRVQEQLYTSSLALEPVIQGKSIPCF